MCSALTVKEARIYKEMESAKDKEIKLIGSRAAQRIELIEKIINDRLNKASIVLFYINDKDKKQIISNLMNHVANWNPGNHEMNNNKKSYEKVRAFWNHKKAEKLGTNLFAPILSLLYKHLIKCMVPSAKFLLLFIEIKCDLLQEKIKFPRTKNLPLICCSCFVKPNKFKTFCETFLRYFGGNIKYELDPMTKTLKINGKSQTKYVRNGSRAKLQHQRYLNAMLQLIKEIKFNYCHDIQFNIKKFNKWAIGDVIGDCCYNIENNNYYNTNNKVFTPTIIINNNNNNDDIHHNDTYDDNFNLWESIQMDMLYKM